VGATGLEPVTPVKTPESANFAADETCASICPTFSEMLTILVLPAALVWALGLIVMYVVGRLRGPRSSSDAGATADTD
jgi:hypothetical protein